MSRLLLAACAGFAIASPAIAQDRLLVLNSSENTIVELEPSIGAFVNPVFASGLQTPTGWSTPKGIAQVNDEVWVADQLRDAIYRFDLDGAYIDMVADPAGTGGLDNIRGLTFHDGIIYQTNAGTQNNAPGLGIVRFDTAGNNLGFWPTIGSPFDILRYNDQWLISDITNHRLDFYDDNGNFVSTFHSGTLRFPQQMVARANGNILVSGFSNPAGIYEIDPQGNQVNFIPVAGPRGIFELYNGNIMYTNGTGIHIYDVVSQMSFLVTSGASQYIALITATEPPCYANCDNSTTAPILNVDDFTCFINEFAGAQSLPHEQQISHYANCDGSTTAPVLNVDDFTCFINAFATGCP